MSPSTRTHPGAHRFSNLPLAIRIAVLSVGISAMLACGLTWLGYTRARDGLAAQVDRTLAADAHVVAQAIDDWNADQIVTLRTLAQTPTVQRILTGDAASPDAMDSRAGFPRGTRLFPVDSSRASGARRPSWSACCGRPKVQAGDCLIARPSSWLRRSSRTSRAISRASRIVGASDGSPRTIR